MHVIFLLQMRLQLAKRWSHKQYKTISFLLSHMKTRSRNGCNIKRRRKEIAFWEEKERRKREKTFKTFTGKYQLKIKWPGEKVRKKHEAKSESEQMLNSSHSTHENWIGKLLFCDKRGKKRKTEISY